MLRRSWRYIAVLLALGLLASLMVGSALAAQPGKGNAQGPKNKGKVVHVNGTVQGTVSATIDIQKMIWRAFPRVRERTYHWIPDLYPHVYSMAVGQLGQSHGGQLSATAMAGHPAAGG